MPKPKEVEVQNPEPTEGDDTWESEIGERFATLEKRLASLEELASELLANLPKFAMMGVPQKLLSRFKKS